MQLFFTLVFTYPAFPQSLHLPTGQIDMEVWKNVMITLEGNNNATLATDTYERLVPEPAGPQVCAWRAGMSRRAVLPGLALQLCRVAYMS